MEFKEFSNPLENDYDINHSYEEEKVNNSTISNPYIELLIDMIGILEDVTEEELYEAYGISEQEYLNPTRDTIIKVKEKLQNSERMHR